MSLLETLKTNAKELGLVGAMFLILIVLFAPIPTVFLDLAIIINFGLALTILLMALHVAKPVDFSTFPSLLLISTLLRLSINVAATRLILTHASAGDVINSVGAFAVGGNFVVGLVVFLILVIVQYVVITSGAQRVSEVAARFTLDSMPGHQMSIDADLNMGLIDQAEAVRRRAELEKEAAFYGSMDGASKFVKGDAVAGVIILLVNIIAGWIIGVMQMGMTWQGALERFTLLTVGDGIATQLPALVIAISTGIIVTRSSADRELSVEVLRQLASMPRIPLIVGVLLVLLLLLPGMPKWPLIPLAGLSYLGWRRLRATTADTSASATEGHGLREGLSRETLSGGASGASGATLTVAVSVALSHAWKNERADLLDRIASLRNTLEDNLGYPFEPIQFVEDGRLPEGEYEIRIYGARFAGGSIFPTQMLAIKGDKTRARIAGVETLDPAFNLPAVWIDPERAEEARASGHTIVDPMTVLTTHLGEILRTEAGSLLTRGAVTRLLNDARARQPGLVEDLTPALLAVSDVQKILQTLLAEGVPIAALDLILEHLVDVARTEKDPSQLAELVRQKVGYIICNKLKDRHRDLAVMSLEPRLEHQVQTAVANSARKDAAVIDPSIAEHLLRQIATMSSDMMRQGRQPVLLCGGEVRRALRALTRRSLAKLSIVSVAEIPSHIELQSFGVIKALAKPAAAKLEPEQASPNGRIAPAFSTAAEAAHVAPI